MSTDVAALDGMEVDTIVFSDYTYGSDSSNYKYAAGVHADRYVENGVYYDELPAQGYNWWNIVSWYPEKPDGDKLHAKDGFTDGQSHYRAEAVPTTDENGKQIDSPADIKEPFPDNDVESYHATSFSVGVNVVGPFSFGASTINVTDPDVISWDAPADHHYVDWTIDTADGNWPDSQSNSNGVNFEAYCNLNDPSLSYDAKYGSGELSINCESQNTFAFFSTRAGGGSKLKDTPIISMYPSVSVV